MSTSTLVEEFKTDDIKDGEMKEVNIKGKEILIARSGDNFYATSNRCTHMGTKLSSGKLEGTIITCPRHGSKFDLKSGEVIRWTKWTGVVYSIIKLFKSPRPIAVYPVKIKGNQIFIDI